MPQSAWSPKRERQYEHIKESLQDRGTKKHKAEAIAARTVNKERARDGEAKTASRTSIDDISSGRRGGLRSHEGSGGRTYDQLRNEARQRGIKGRSKMRKSELEKILTG
jgi:plasmid stabilization system protein ParE